MRLPPLSPCRAGLNGPLEQPAKLPEEEGWRFDLRVRVRGARLTGEVQLLSFRLEFTGTVLNEPEQLEVGHASVC